MTHNELLKNIEKSIQSKDFIDSVKAINFNPMLGPNTIEVDLYTSNNISALNARPQLHTAMRALYPQYRFSFVFIKGPSDAAARI